MEQEGGGVGVGEVLEVVVDGLVFEEGRVQVELVCHAGMVNFIFIGD